MIDKYCFVISNCTYFKSTISFETKYLETNSILILSMVSVFIESFSLRKLIKCVQLEMKKNANVNIHLNIKSIREIEFSLEGWNSLP